MLMLKEADISASNRPEIKQAESSILVYIT
jgi:hypothetical protein